MGFRGHEANLVFYRQKYNRAARRKKGPAVGRTLSLQRWLALLVLLVGFLRIAVLLAALTTLTLLAALLLLLARLLARLRLVLMLLAALLTALLTTLVVVCHA
jgi:hypothetical protein